MTATKQLAVGSSRAAVVEGLVDGVAASRIRSAVAIVLLVLVAFLPGFVSIAPLDRDEPRFAAATRHMVETGDYLRVTVPDGPMQTPSIGVHWLQAASIVIFGEGTEIWVYRVPSLLAAIAVALLTWWMALAFGRPRAALLAGIIVGFTPLLVAEAHLAKADGLLLAAIVLAQGALARLWLKKQDRPDYPLAFLFWAALAAGILANILTAVAAIGLTVVALCAFSRSAAWLRRLAPVAGALATFVLVAPWIVASLFAASGSGGNPLDGVAVQQDYGAPPGTYAFLFYPLFGPAGVFVALAIPAVLERVRRPVYAFSIACAVPYWLLMELMPAKLPPYILPAYPALALVAATTIDERRLHVTGWVSTYFALNLTVWPVLVGLGATGLFVAAEDRWPIAAIPFFLAAICVGAFSFRWFYREISLVGAAALSFLSAALMYVGLFAIVLPGLDAVRVAGRLIEAGRESVACGAPAMVAAGYPEPSLIFTAGSALRVVTPEAAADFLAEGGCRVAFVEARRQSVFNQRLADIGVEAEVRGVVRGFNIGNWKAVDMRIFSVAGAAQ